MMPSQAEKETTQDDDPDSHLSDSSEDDRFFRKWNQDDGCTNSILSSKSEKENLMVDVHLGSSLKGQFTRLNLLDLVDNIEDIAVFAENMNITKNKFINCLREVTRQKIYDIRQAKRIFEQRIRKLQVAQSYEVQNQKVYAINTA